VQTALTFTVNSLVISSMYILVALGFALLLSIMGIFNFAHGAIYMIGAYMTYAFTVLLGINQWISLLLSMLMCGLLGLFLERFCFRPFIGNIDGVVMMTIAIGYILTTTVNVTLGGRVIAVPHFIPSVLQQGYLSVSTDRLVTLVVGGLLLLVMFLIIRYSKVGHQMLAISQDYTGAALQGININLTSGIATAIGCGLAALSGSLMGALLSLYPFMGDTVLLKAIQVVILSGIGSMGGILVGGLIIGTMDAVLPVLTSAPVAQAAGLGIIIIILLFRPKGLFGYELF
jgi:branched-chain amino acid transport system permease protein